MDPATVAGEVRFEDVDFSYQADSEQASDKILHDVDLVIPAGSTVAVVGPTGSGKSTMAALLPRIYDPTDGRVLIDGVVVRDQDQKILSTITVILFYDVLKLVDYAPYVC